MQDAIAKAKILMEALPWIKEYKGKTVVIKYGGKAMTDENLKQSVANDITMMHFVGLYPVVVHGGGPEISQAMKEKGLKPQFVDGLRVTDEKVMEIVSEVTKSICDGIVENINKHGDLATGFCGDLLLAQKKEHDQELGFVGKVSSVDKKKLSKATDEGQVPIISSIGKDESGQLYNINADDVSASVAESIKSEKLVYLTDVNGIYGNKGDEDSLISVLKTNEGVEMIEKGKLTGGMVPKLLSCIEAISTGVHHCHILNGTIDHVLLLEVFTNEGVGTMITG